MPTEEGRLGVLLLSFASVGGQQHQRTMYAPAFIAHPACTVVSVAEEADAPSDLHALSRREADALGLPYVDLDAALADPRIDVVCVCSPFERRARVIERIAAAGKHMLVDKPLALTLADCDAIERSTREAAVICMPAHHYRFHPALRAARTAVAEGTIGLPWGLQGEFIVAAGSAVWPLGELANFGLYPVDAIRAITALEVRTVYATRGTFFHDGEGAAREDLAVLALTLEHGVIATTTVGRGPTAGRVTGSAGDRRLRIMGSHGTLVVDASKPALTVSHAGRAEQRYYGADSLPGLLDHLVACVRGDSPPEVGPKDARAALEVVLAARVASDEDRVVELPLARSDHPLTGEGSPSR